MIVYKKRCLGLFLLLTLHESPAVRAVPPALFSAALALMLRALGLVEANGEVHCRRDWGMLLAACTSIMRSRLEALLNVACVPLTCCDSTESTPTTRNAVHFDPHSHSVRGR